MYLYVRSIEPHKVSTEALLNSSGRPSHRFRLGAEKDLADEGTNKWANEDINRNTDSQQGDSSQRRKISCSAGLWIFSFGIVAVSSLICSQTIYPPPPSRRGFFFLNIQETNFHDFVPLALPFQWNFMCVISILQLSTYVPAAVSINVLACNLLSPAEFTFPCRKIFTAQAMYMKSNYGLWRSDFSEGNSICGRQTPWHEIL